MNRLTQNFTILLFTAFTFLSLAMVLLPIAKAQQTSIAVVDKAKVASGAKAWKDFQKKLDSDVKTFQKKVRKYEAELADLGRSLVEKKNDLTPADLKAKQQELQKKQTSYNKELSGEKLSLDQRVQKAERALNKGIDDATSEIGRKRELTLILNAAMVVYQEKSFDITQEVTDLINKQVKKLPSK